MKIFDLFMYNGEKDILDIRLNILYQFVDFFVVGSSEYSHSGIYKGISKIPEHLLEKFKNKIIFINIPYSYNPDPWIFEQFSREYIYQQIKKELKNEDILHISDLDEIPKSDIFLKTIKELNQPATFYGDSFLFCLDLYVGEAANGFLIKNKWYIDNPNITLGFLRNHRTNFKYNIFNIIKNSSYHFSSIGTPEQIAKKMSYFAHCNDTPFMGSVRNPEHILKLIKGKCGFTLNTPNQLKQIEVNNNNLPQYIVDNREKFKHLFYNNYIINEN